MAARSEMIHRYPRALVPLWAATALLCACQSKDPPAATQRAPSAVTPDRLPPEERSPDTATAFGLSLPKGMELTRQFHNSAYFLGRLDLATVVEHLKPHLDAKRVESNPGHTVFEQATLKDGSSERRLRVDVSAEGPGTQVFVQDITPPPAPSGVSEAEMLRRAGRNPNGTPMDENQQY